MDRPGGSKKEPDRNVSMVDHGSSPWQKDICGDSLLHACTKKDHSPQHIPLSSRTISDNGKCAKMRSANYSIQIVCDNKKKRKGRKVPCLPCVAGFSSTWPSTSQYYSDQATYYIWPGFEPKTSQCASEILSIELTRPVAAESEIL